MNVSSTAYFYLRSGNTIKSFALVHGKIPVFLFGFFVFIHLEMDPGLVPVLFRDRFIVLCPEGKSTVN